MERLTFTSDPVGGDGVIVDRINGESWPTEHVLVPRHRQGTSIDALIREAVRKKRSKGGQAYALGKTLVVFLDVIGGPWFPTKVAAGLPKPLWFDAVWVMGLQSADDGYIYNVTRLDNSLNARSRSAGTGRNRLSAAMTAKPSSTQLIEKGRLRARDIPQPPVDHLATTRARCCATISASSRKVF